MKMFHKFINPGQMKRILRIGGGVRTAGEDGFFIKGMYYLFTILLLMTVVIQCLVNNAEAKSVVQRSKKTLKLLQSSSSLIQLRHKRDTFANEQQEQQLQHQTGEGFVRPRINYYENIAAEDDDGDDYDYNYDVLPGRNGSEQPSSITDQISETAKQIAQSFTNMWQSLTESIRQCMEGLRAMFTQGFDEADLTPEQLQQLRVAMEQQGKPEHDNEVFINNYEYKL